MYIGQKQNAIITTIRGIYFFLRFRSIRAENAGTARAIPNVSPLEMSIKRKDKPSRTYAESFFIGLENNNVNGLWNFL